MKIAAYCFFTLLILAFIMAFRESMPEPLGVLGNELAQGLEGIVKLLRRYFTFKPE